MSRPNASGQGVGASFGPGSHASHGAAEASPPVGFDPSRGIYREVVRSLRERPWEWRRRLSNLIHRQTGITVWIGNDTYGMDITGGPFGDVLWGGVTALSSFGLSLKHRRLRKAADFCLGAIVMEARQGGDACGSVHDSAAPSGDRP